MHANVVWQQHDSALVPSVSKFTFWVPDPSSLKHLNSIEGGRRGLTGRGDLAGGVVDLREVGMREGLLHSDALGRVELQHLLQQVDRQRVGVRKQRPE